MLLYLKKTSLTLTKNLFHKVFTCFLLYFFVFKIINKLKMLAINIFLCL
ncbi:hypothetical Protein psc1_06520 [Candidatus Phytoplasma solani]